MTIKKTSFSGLPDSFTPRDVPGVIFNKIKPLLAGGPVPPETPAIRLEKCENSFRAIFNNARDGILVADSETMKFHQCNKMICKMLGYSEQELLKLQVKDIHPPEFHAEVLVHFEKLKRKQINIARNIPVLRKDGSVIHMDISSAPFVYGGRIYIAGFFRDVTERNKAEEELKKSEHFLDKIINSVADPVFVKNRGHKFVLANDALCAFLGRERGELLGRTDYDFFPKAQADVFRKKDEEVFRTGGENVNEEQITDMEGNIRTIVTKKTLYKDNSGGEFIVGIIRDITVNKRAEETLKESEFRLSEALEFNKNILNTSSIGIVTYDENGQCDFANKAAAQIVGSSVEGVLALNFHQIASWKKSGMYEAALTALNTGAERHLEVFVETTFGKNVWLNMRFSSFFSAGKKHLLLFMYDVTAQRLAVKRLGENEKRYRDLFESSGTGIVIVDGNGRYLMVNKQAAGFFGRKPEEVFGKPMSAFLPRKTAEKYLKANRRLIRDGGRREYEDTFKMPGGERTFLIVDRCIKNGSGRNYAVQSSSIDITDRKQMERQNAEQLELAMKLASASSLEEIFSPSIKTALGMAGMDCGGIYMFDEESGALILEYSEGVSPEFIRKNRIYPRGSEREKLVRGGRFFFLSGSRIREQEDLRREGLRAIAVFPIKYRGKPVGCMNLASHSLAAIPRNGMYALETLTAQLGNAIGRLKAENKLGEKENQFRGIFNNMSSSVAVYEPVEAGKDFIIIDFNRAAEKSEKIGKKDVVGKLLTKVFPGVAKFGLLKVFRRVLKTGRSVHVPVKYYQDGRISGWRDNFIYKLPSGQVVAIYKDVSERIQDETALRESENKFREMADLLPQAIFEMDIKGNLTYGNKSAFHQFRYTKQDFARGLKAPHMIAEEDRERALEDIGKRMITENVTNKKYNCQRKDGTIFPAIIDTNPILREGRITGLRGIIIDITESKRYEESLKRSEEQYRVLVENQQDLICRWRPDTTITFVNDAFCLFLGRKREHIVGKKLLKFIPSDLRGEIKLYYGSLASRPRVYSYDHALSDAYGHEHWLSWIGTPSIAGGKLLEFQSIGRDMTERVKMEKELRDREQKLANIIDHSDELFYIRDLNQQFKYFSPQCLNLLGYYADEMALKWNSLLTDNPVNKTAREAIKNAVKTGEKQKPYLAEIRRKDGRRVLLEIDESPVCDADGTVMSIAGAARDVTAHWKAEEALKELQRQQEAILSNIPDIAWLKDRESRFIAVNETFGRACGLRPSEIAGKTDIDIWPGELARKYVADDRKVMKTGKRMMVEEPLADVSGKIQWIETIKIPIIGNKGKITGTTGIARDITGRKKLEDERRMLAKQVLLAREEEKKNFSSLLHDETGSFALALNSYLSLAEESLKAGNIQESDSHIRKLKKMVKDQVDILKNIAYEIRPPALDVSGLEGAVKELVSRSLSCTSFRINSGIAISGGPEIPDYTAIVIYRITQEALTNIVKYSRASSVRILLKWINGKIKLEIRDDGCGFDPAGKVFSHGPGKLGLKIMRDEAEAAGGTLEISSKPGKGTVLKAVFPV